MKKIIPLLLLLLAQTLSAVDFRLLSFADYYGSIEAEDSYDHLRARLYLQPKLQTPLPGSAADLTLSLNFWYQIEGDETFIDGENILREAYVTFPFGSFDVALGQKFETFGFTDLYSPLNVINGSDLSIFSLDDNIDGRRADAMVQLQFYPNFDDTIELIYIPFPRPNYEPRGTVEISDSTVDARLDFTEQPYLTDNPHSLFLRYYHISNSFDLQLIYAWYTDQTPGFDLEELDDSGAVLTGTADTVYTRSNLFGAGLSTTLGETVLSEDLAFNLTEDFDGSDPGVKNSFITANTQFTRSILKGTFAQLNVVYQYILNYDDFEGEYGDPLYDTLSEEINDYFIQPREHIAFFILHLHKSYLRDKLYLGLNTGYLHPAVYIAPRISYALSDRMKVEGGADIKTVNPPDNNLLRSNEQDNFYIRMKIQY